MESSTGRACPVCAALVEQADNFCEACGRVLADTTAERSVAACRNCQSTHIDADGYCELCGQKSPSRRDHLEIDLGSLVGVTDRGRRHHRNEDAMAIALVETPIGPASLAAVCDGVSTSDRPDEAASAAANKAVEVLAAAVRAGIDAEDALITAALAADSAVRGLAGDSDNAPAATFVAAVATHASITVCWIGDSRAYWLPADANDAPRLLTRDDSLAEELVALGVIAEDDAIGSPHEHIVTRWLGADANEHEPHISVVHPAGPGLLLLCSDGLWNYQPDAEGIMGLILPTALKDLASACATLLAFALDAGGQDNITVVLAAAPPATPETTTSEGSSR